MESTRGGHAPLCRTSRGNIVRPRKYENAPPQQHVLQHLPVQRVDSCYSSCDDISHPSLSRESSDNSQADHSDEASSSSSMGVGQTQVPPEMVQFATKLGFSLDQLVFAMSRVGLDAKQDTVLAELVKLGNRGAHEHAMARAAANAHASPRDPTSNLRPIVIDGSNVAMAFGFNKVFACAGIREAVRFFTERGHKEIFVFIPQFRKEQPRADSPITDQHILFELERFICWTPSRNVNGRRVICHDDRYILKTAEEKDAIIVSNDEYRDLCKENPEWVYLVGHQQLMFTVVDDKFVPPDDPLGRYGPRLDTFLSKASALPGAQVCPYARKCTYGNKCKFYHPERANGQHMSVTERLMKENQHKKSLAGVKSMQYEMFKNKQQQQQQHNNHVSLGRTQSLGVAATTATDNSLLARQHVPMAHVGGVTWHPQQHSVISRNSSMPLSPLNSLGGMNNRVPSTISQTHLYAPSTAVWGHSELSVGPVSTDSQTHDYEPDARARVQYHLSNIFPENVVEAVMIANPDETDAQVLCEKILKMGRGIGQF